MSKVNSELSDWHDWANPDFFANANDRERRIVPLFLRQLLPSRAQRTKLTLTGWMLILVALGIGSAAYNTASNILFLTLSLILSSLVLSGILSQINFRKLKWELDAPEHSQVGEVGMASVCLTNKKRIFPSMSLCFRVSRLSEDPEVTLYLKQAVKAGESRRLEWTFKPVSRGRLRVSLSGVESQFPFGFLLKTIGVEISQEVLVWPERIEYSFQPTNAGRRILSGVSRKNAGIGSDLLNLRPYERGDPPRLVHWKATARMGKLMIRQLAQEGEGGYHLYLDPDQQRWGVENFEVLCSTAFSVAESLFRAGRLETVQIRGSASIMIGGLRELHDFFDRLALLEPTHFERHSKPESTTNLITFRPSGERDIAIYVEATKAGQTHG